MTARSISVAVSYLFGELLIRPLSLARKIAMRTGVWKRSPRSWRIPMRRSKLYREVRYSIDIGNPTEALDRIRSAKLHERVLLRREKREAADLATSLRPLDGSSLESVKCLKRPGQESGERVSQNAELNVAYFVNNSTPYTKSGYTLRTDSLVEAVKNVAPPSSNFTILKVTRLGYPEVIGKLVDRGVKDLCYLTPWLMPISTTRRYRAAVKLLSDQVSFSRVKVLHTTTPFENARIAKDVARFHSIPWIYEFRGEPHNTWLSTIAYRYQDEAKSSERYRLSRLREIEAAKAADHVITLSEISKKMLISSGVDESKITVIPNSIDLSSFDLAGEQSGIERRRALGLAERMVVGVISSLVAYEGIDRLIKVLPDLPSDLVVLIVGDGEERPVLQALALALGVGDRCIFVGARPAYEMPSWYGAIDVLCVPRKNEEVCRNVTPIKPLGALALRKPVVASDLPALREVTGGFGKFVDSDNATELRCAIIEAIRHPDRFHASKSFLNARRWELAGGNLFEVYRTLRSAGA